MIRQFPVAYAEFLRCYAGQQANQRQQGTVQQIQSPRKAGRDRNRACRVEDIAGLERCDDQTGKKACPFAVQQCTGKYQQQRKQGLQGGDRLDQEKKRGQVQDVQCQHDDSQPTFVGTRDVHLDVTCFIPASQMDERNAAAIHQFTAFSI